MIESWLPIQGYSGYQVSDHGRVVSYRSGKPHMLALGINHKGYLRAQIYNDDGKMKAVFVHKLVAMAFIGARPDNEMHINHIDGDKQNNHVANLEYVTVLENMRHAIALGLREHIDFHGARNPAAILQEWQVVEIMGLLKAKRLTTKEIGDRYGVEKSIVSLINCGRNWAYLSTDGVFPIRQGRARLGG